MRNKFILLFCISAIIISCSSDPRSKLPETGTFGIAFTEDSLLTVSQVVSLSDSMVNIPVKVTGTITQFCKGEGCWLTLKSESGKDLFIEVANKTFVLPYNISNKTANVNGTLMKDEADGGKVSILADGIIIR